MFNPHIGVLTWVEINASLHDLIEVVSAFLAWAHLNPA
jgi:hypothetical protein